MVSSIARSFKLEMTLFLKTEHHPYGQANGWGHSSPAEFGQILGGPGT